MNAETHPVLVGLLKQPVDVLHRLWLVDGGGVAKRPDGAVAALDAQELVGEEGPGVVFRRAGGGGSGCVLCDTSWGRLPAVTGASVEAERGQSTTTAAD
jgi:hypothetical protein